MLNLQNILFVISSLSLLLCLSFLYLSFQKKSKYNFYKKIPNVYTKVVNVDCVEVYGKDILKREYRGLDINDRETHSSVIYSVKVPIYRGWLMNKCYTFCRSKDVDQPMFTFVGGSTRLYLRQGKVNCKDFYEESEIPYYKNQYRKEYINYRIASVFYSIIMILTCYFAIIV